MNIQRLRNLTTHRLHTKMSDIYEDIEFLTGAPGIMTHQIPAASRALDPWLKEKVKDARFFDGEHDAAHEGEIEIEPMNAAERNAFFERYANESSPLANKKPEEIIILKA